MKHWKKNTKHWKKIALSLCLAAGSLAGLAPARAAETDCVIHDPSAIVKSGGTYWVFGTGVGVCVYSSTDRRHWTPQPPVFAAAPSWVAAAVPGNTRRDYWAPDVRRVGDRYFLYYSVSTFGSNTSAIGLATSPSLQSPHWSDQGIVIRSTAADNYNAIDPCIAGDTRGGLWLSFGSFWSGIKMVPLDRVTGKPATQHPPVLSLAAHPQDRADSIEASYLFFHQGYYYLFVNWDFCCRGPRSTYNVRVGRSRAITGPFLDKSGQDMRTGGGTPFLPASAPGASEIGPGQAGILADSGGFLFSCHYEWAEDQSGRPVLNLMKLVWDKGGWPALQAGT